MDFGDPTFKHTREHFKKLKDKDRMAKEKEKIINLISSLFHQSVDYFGKRTDDMDVLEACTLLDPKCRGMSDEDAAVYLSKLLQFFGYGHQEVEQSAI